MMRSDQYKRLAELEEKLADVVLEEADPDLWPGAGVTPADMSQEERGNRYWCKKNAAATFALLQRTSSLLTDSSGNHTREDEEGDMDKEIAKAEKEAARILEKVGRA